MPNLAETVIQLAEAEIGYLEKKSSASLDSKTANAGSGNYTKYWRDIYPSYQGQPWCQCFVDWCFARAYGEVEAKKLLNMTGGWSFYTPSAANSFKGASQWHTSGPQAGDLIYFKNSARIHHVGIVYKVDSSRVYTIEGNTSGGSAVIANGGAVCKKSYLLNNSAIAGYGRPKYDAAAFVPYKVKTTGNLHVRAEATAASKSLGILNKDHVFTIRGVDGSWGKVLVIADSNGKTVSGWVSLRYTKKL
mgnify:CR=1 FL=1